MQLEPRNRIGRRRSENVLELPSERGTKGENLERENSRERKRERGEGRLRCDIGRRFSSDIYRVGWERSSFVPAKLDLRAHALVRAWGGLAAEKRHVDCDFW